MPIELTEYPNKLKCVAAIISPKFPFNLFKLNLSLLLI